MPRPKPKKRQSVVCAQDDDIFNRLFVAAVKCEPVLYDFRIPGYSCKENHKATWQKLSERFGESENNLKQRWKNLRAALLRHIRAELRAQQSGKPLVLKPYYMLDQLQFLIPFTRVEKPSNPRYDLNVDSTTENANEEDTEDSLADEEFIKEDATVLVQDEDDNIYLTGRRTAEEEDNLEPSENEAKRVIVQDSKEIEDLQSKVLRASQPEIQQSATEIRHEDTPEWSFFHSLMPDILAMTSAQKRKMRLRFLEVVDDILSAND